jgi:hypothetical protein
MALSQNVAIEIHADGYDVTIKNPVVYHGQFHEQWNKESAVAAESIENRVISAGQQHTIYACGVPYAAVGAEGSLDLYVGEEHVGKYYWNCPWGGHSNTSEWTHISGNSSIHAGLSEAGNLGQGAIGRVIIKVSNSWFI